MVAGMVALAGLVLVGAGSGQAACSTTICVGGGSSCTISGNNTVDCTCTLDFGTKDVTISGNIQPSAENCSLTLKANSFDVRGTLQSRGPSGLLDIQAVAGFTLQVVSNSSAKLDVKNGGTLQVTAGGAANILGKDVIADGGTNGTAGTITITGSSFHNTCSVHADASSDSDGGSITLEATNGSVTVDGTTTALGAGADGFGGAIAINATGTITTSKSLNVSGGGEGGTIDVFTTQTGSAGLMTIGGTVLANATSTDADAGQITFDGGSLSTSTDWTANAGTGGSFGEIDIAATGGDITTTSASSMTLNTGGGGSAGDVDIEGDHNVDLGGNITANSNGDGCFAGTVTVVAGNNHTLYVRKTIEAKGTTANCFFDGTVDLSACNITLVTALKTRNSNVDTGLGTNFVTYNGSYTATNATMLADDSGGNEIYCRCVDTSPADGTCDGTPTCVTAPSLSGATITPTQDLIPIPMAACG
jgi:hypothetical protein